MVILDHQAHLDMLATLSQAIDGIEAGDGITNCIDGNVYATAGKITNGLATYAVSLAALTVAVAPSCCAKRKLVITDIDGNDFGPSARAIMIADRPTPPQP